MTEPLSSPPPHEVPGTAGQWLRQARTRQGIHLAMLSVALKVPVRTLELLEADRHEELPGPTFIRALASSVCRHLRLDPAEVLTLLPQRDAQMSPPPASLEAAVPTPRAGRRWSADRTQLTYIVLAVGMVAVIVGLLWWPAPSAEAPAPVPGVSFMPPPDSALSAASDPEVLAAPANPVMTPDATTPATLSPSAAVTTSSAAAAAATPPGPSASLAAPSTRPASAPAPMAGQTAVPALRLSASGESWVEVRSSDDQVLFSQVLQAGEVHEVRHTGALKVVVGRAAVMQVQVKGQNFDLVPHTKVTVARFEVRP